MIIHLSDQQEFLNMRERERDTQFKKGKNLYKLKCLEANRYQFKHHFVIVESKHN